MLIITEYTITDRTQEICRHVDIAYETKHITFFKSMPKWCSELYGINYQLDKSN